MKVLMLRFVALGMVLALLPAVAMASLTVNYQFNGKGNWSLDAIGSNSAPVGAVQAVVPVGSTVQKAFLYSSKVWGNQNVVPNVTLAATNYSGAAWTALGITGALQAYRTDVTAQIAAAIGGGSNVPFNFSVSEVTNNNGTDGEVLAIVYSNPAEMERTIALLDGVSAFAGDSATFNFSSPWNPAVAGAEALMSLGIGYGFQPSGQVSLVDGNGRRLTSSAGGQDDGGGFNGGLITVGGLGDSSANPAPFAPAANARTDDELYDLAQGNVANANPFLTAGDLSIRIDTSNPSNDDNIFLWGFNVTARGSVNEPPPPPIVPEPASVIVWSLLGLTFAGVGWRRRRREA